MGKNTCFPLILIFSYWFEVANRLSGSAVHILFFFTCLLPTLQILALWTVLLLLLFSAQSCPTLCDPTDYSTPGLPVPHHLPEIAQVHVHCIGDPIQPSHPLMPSSLSALHLFQHQSFQWIFRFLSLKIDWLISLLFKGLSEVFSSTTVQRHQFFGVLPSLLLPSLRPAFTTVCDHREDQSLDYTDLCQQSNNASAFQNTV